LAGAKEIPAPADVYRDEVISMTNSVNSLQSAQSQTQKEEAVQPPKTIQAQTEKQITAPQDQVTISQQARQALVNNSE
jgi:hypothetical protein